MTKQKQLPWAFLEEYRGKDFTGEWPTFPELLRIQTKRFSDTPFLTDFDGPNGSKNTLTHQQAFDKIESLAKFLISLGIKKGDKIAVTGKNSPEWAISYLATLYASGIVIPIDAGLHEPEVRNIINTAEPKVIICDDDKAAFISKDFPDIPVFLLNNTNPEKYIYNLIAKEQQILNDQPVENDTAAILFTSGTTGKPKGVMLSHKNLISDGFIAQTNLTIYPNDVFYALKKRFF